MISIASAKYMVTAVMDIDGNYKTPLPIVKEGRRMESQKEEAGWGRREDSCSPLFVIENKYPAF